MCDTNEAVLFMQLPQKSNRIRKTDTTNHNNKQSSRCNYGLSQADDEHCAAPQPTLWEEEDLPVEHWVLPHDGDACLPNVT